MKVVITDRHGRLGKWLHKLYGFESLDCDLLDVERLEDRIKTLAPDVIIHNAAMTNVEECESNPSKAFDVNVRGTKNIVDFFPKGTLLYMSSCHVFNGASRKNYDETRVPNPVNKYGWTKYAGEGVSWLGTCRSIVVRTSKLFDYEYLSPGIEQLSNGQVMEQPDYIVRSFMYTPKFCKCMVNLIDYNVVGENIPYTIHIAGLSSCSHYDFWKYVAQQFGVSENDPDGVMARNIPLTDIVPRPYWGGLDCTFALRAGIIPTEFWKDDVETCIRDQHGVDDA